MLHASVSAQKLGVMRIAVFALVFAHVLSVPIEHLSQLPSTLHPRMGLLHLLPEPAWEHLRSITGLRFLRLAVLAGAVLSMLGTRGYRIIALTTGIGWLAFEGSLYLGSASHRQLATIYCVFILAVFPATDAVSVSARRRSEGTDGTPYVAAMQLMAFCFLFTYTATAFYRFAHGSPDIFWDDTLVTHIIGNSGRNGSFGLTYGAQLVRALGPYTFILGGLFFLGSILEALALLCFFSRWFRLAYVGFIVSFHTFNLLTMNIEFTLNCFLAILLLIEWDPWKTLFIQTRRGAQEGVGDPLALASSDPSIQTRLDPGAEAGPDSGCGFDPRTSR